MKYVYVYVICHMSWVTVSAFSPVNTVTPGVSNLDII